MFPLRQQSMPRAQWRKIELFLESSSRTDPSTQIPIRVLTRPGHALNEYCGSGSGLFGSPGSVFLPEPDPYSTQTYPL